MADTTTTAYGLTKPEIGASEDTWGTKINTDLDTLDTVVNAIGGKTAAATLSYADAAKIATTATGIDVTGTILADGLNLDGNIQGDNGQNMIVSAGEGSGDKLDLRAGDDVRIWVDGFNAHQKAAEFANNGDISFYEDSGTTPKFFWDASAESLGIGTSSPSATYSLDIAKGIRVSAAAPSVELVETDSSNQRWSMLSTAGVFGIRDITGSTYPVQIETTAPTNSIRIDSSGNVGIGTGSPSGILQVQASNPNVYITSADTGQSDIYFGGTTAPTKGRIQYSDNADFMAFYTDSTERMRIDSSGHAIIPAGVTLGTAAGVYAADNTLDDYEEGAYAAALTCGTSGTITLTASQDTLAYTKIGRTVTVQGQIVVTSVSSPSGQLRISLPFTVTNLGDISERSAGAVALNSVAFTGNYVTLTTSTSGVAYATFLQTDSGSSWSALDANLISSSSLLRVGFTFITND